VSEFLNAHADGLALMFWALVGLCVALVLAAAVEPIVGRWHRRRRHERGEWAHQAALRQVAQDYARRSR
jgi:hypothetical protein